MTKIDTGPSITDETPDVFGILSVELQTFRDNREALLVDGNLGKWALIKGDTVVCALDTQIDAINTGTQEFHGGPFLVAKVLPLDRAAIFSTPELNL